MRMIEERTACTQADSAHRDVPDLVWDKFVDKHAFGHFLQTSAWRMLKEDFGWSGDCVTLRSDGGDIVAGATILFRRVAGLTIAYVPRGPVTDWENRELTASLLAQVEDAAQQRGAVALIVEPSLSDTPHNHRLLTAYRLRPSSFTIQPRSTIQLDLTKSEGDILRQMKSKWRYNIRLSGRKDVTVRAAERKDLHHFRRLMQMTGERDGFGIHSAAYYARAYDLIVPTRGVYLVAEYDNRPLGAIVVVCSGNTAIYLWGASSNEERNRMPNHALQWAGMQWAMAAGARRYDMWGIPDDIGAVAVGMGAANGTSIETHDLPLNLEELPSEDLWGVFRFKQGFGGEVVRLVGAWERPLHPVGYRLYQTGLAVRSLPRDRTALRAELQRQGQKYAHRLWQVYKEITQPPMPVTDEGMVRSIEHAELWRKVLHDLCECNPHVLQSWEWGEVKAQTGWQAHRYSVQRISGGPVGAFQLLRRRLVPSIPLYYSYVPKGPVVDWQDAAAVDMLLSCVQQSAAALGCIAVKIDPDVCEETESGRQLRVRLETRGWCYSSEQIQFKNTAMSDLGPDEDDLLADMKSKWRYNIRLAERRGIKVRIGAYDDLQAFYDLYAETGRRDGFLVRPVDYYLTTWRTFLGAQQDGQNPAGGVLLLAEHAEESKPLAGIFLLRYGCHCWYFYGASSSRRRRDMPNYLLQWEALRWAKAQGCTVYDWWGAPTHLEDEEDELQGVWRFKQGFGAEFVAHLGAWDYPIRPGLHTLFVDAVPRVLHLFRMVRNLRESKRERKAE